MTTFGALTPRWTTLRHHAEQWRLWNSQARFRVVVAGRRSGKTEIAKRLGVEYALTQCLPFPDTWVVFAAPTHDQAINIFWNDLKALIPKDYIVGDPSESRHIIRLVNGAEISVLGLDKPQRIEGRPIDWICVDEFSMVKPETFARHIRPALSTEGRLGRGWFTGVPRGRNHYYHLYEFAMAEKAKLGDASDWDVFCWKSADILDAAEIAAALHETDILTFQQEYEASFVNFAGRAYYPFERSKHAIYKLPYRKRVPLLFSFDFNREPGVASVNQHHYFETPLGPKIASDVCAGIGEVYIPKNSNTVRVCRRLIEDWGPKGKRAVHVGEVHLDADATGGAGGSAKVEGSDLDLILREFANVPGWEVIPMWGGTNPRERARVNAVNAALEAADGTISYLLDPEYCPMRIRDYEGVTVIEGGSGEINKDQRGSDPKLTHLSDADGYHIARAHPVVEHVTLVEGI